MALTLVGKRSSSIAPTSRSLWLRNFTDLSITTPIFKNGKRYRDQRSFFTERFGGRVQKISLDTGFTCPNRDNTKGIGGCTYCNNNTFKPFYTAPDIPIQEQLEKGISFFSKKYRTMRFLAYFQSYTNTYADLGELRELYEEALKVPNVIGLVIGTRPDCINEEVVSLLSELAGKHFVSLELGIESTLNRTLGRINRCHSYEETVAAYELADTNDLHLGAHLILGLPGESRQDLLDHTLRINDLPIDTLKLHQLQIVRHTRMALQWKETPEMFNLFSAADYIDLVCEFLARLRPDIVVDRITNESPPDKLIAPKWDSLKNFEVVAKLDRRMEELDLWQGKMLD